MRNSKLTNREQRIFLLYRFFLFNSNINNALLELRDSKTFTSAEEEGIHTILNNIDRLVDDIKPFLKSDWKWERLNKLEQAILVNGVAEIKLFMNNKKIVINESIEITKKYCQDNARSLVNAVLDNF